MIHAFTKKQTGITIVELIIVIVIIGVLTAVTFVGSNKIMKDSRDASRKSTVTLITEALEKYHNKNGEYPAVRSLVNTVSGNTGTVVAEKLGLNPEDMKMPKMPETGTVAQKTNPLTAGSTPHDDYITYEATPGGLLCQINPNGGCEHFTMKYLEESGDTVTIESRHG